MVTTLNAVVIPAEGDPRRVDIEQTLTAFQEVVGGYIEGVFDEKSTLYVNEEGLLLNLPLNTNATAFAHDVMGRPVTLFGTALILGPADSEGNDTSIHPDVSIYFN